MIQLQKAQSKDVAFLENLHKTTIGSLWSRDDFMSAIHESDKNVFLITADDTPIGYIMVALLPPEAELINIAVTPDKQRGRIGTSALEILFKEFFIQKIESVFLEVRETSKAVNFYKKNGFEPIGVRRQYYPDGENALRMQKTLRM